MTFDISAFLKDISDKIDHPDVKAHKDKTAEEKMAERENKSTVHRSRTGITEEKNEYPPRELPRH